MIHYTCDHCHKAVSEDAVVTYREGKDICKDCLITRIWDMSKALSLCNRTQLRMMDKNDLLAMVNTLAEFFIRMNQSPKEILEKAGDIDGSR